MIDDRSGTGERQDGNRLSVSEAAERLGLSVDAIRSRLRRGTLEGGKDGDLWYVLLPEETETPQQDADREATDGDRDALVDQLRGENAYLRDQLAVMIQQAADANERADILQARLMDRLPTGERQDTPPPGGVSTETSEMNDQGSSTPGTRRPAATVRLGASTACPTRRVSQTLTRCLPLYEVWLASQRLRRSTVAET